MLFDDPWEELEEFSGEEILEALEDLSKMSYGEMESLKIDGVLTTHYGSDRAFYKGKEINFEAFSKHGLKIPLLHCA